MRIQFILEIYVYRRKEMGYSGEKKPKNVF